MTQAILQSSQASSKRPVQCVDAGVRKLRIALYSHDTMGMGHMRRNLMISQALSYSNLQTSILMITGARQASAAQMPPGVDCITLPSLRKESNGNYLPRSLDIPVEDLKRIRAQMIRASIAAFEPDIFIVDNVPRGALNELDATLEDIRRQNKTSCVLGLRDVLDEPEQVKAEWHKAGNEEMIDKFYDKIWIYGDPNVYDAVHEYKMTRNISDKVSYTGYFDRRICFEQHTKHAVKSSRSEFNLPDGRFVLCMAGGGQDGAPLTKTFARATLPEDMFGVIVTGPFMPPEMKAELHHIAASRTNLRVLEFVNKPTFLIHQADYVIAMGGYNVVSEILSFEKHALIVPRTTPRHEQRLRAERLKTLGIIDVVLPDQLTPERLSAWMENASRYPSTPSVHAQIDFSGLSRLPALVNEICHIKQ
ncbi:Mlr3248 protein [hydrothermal vent metagenome]|uniref:Mlr3248 protein n=1 Tax=hydrothermal vent metagenome TaxID=652676 RepID=A0A3B1ANY9_9ZZZZ